MTVALHPLHSACYGSVTHLCGLPEILHSGLFMKSISSVWGSGWRPFPCFKYSVWSWGLQWNFPTFKASPLNLLTSLASPSTYTHTPHTWYHISFSFVRFKWDYWLKSLVPVHAVPCCIIQVSPSLPRLITYGDPTVHHRGTCVIHLGQSSGTWHALFRKLQTSVRLSSSSLLCSCQSTVQATNPIQKLTTATRSSPPLTLFEGEKTFFFLSPSLFFNVGDATAVITTEL